jgi:hypothetical protein
MSNAVGYDAKNFKRCRIQRLKIISAVGYSVKKTFKNDNFFGAGGYKAKYFFDTVGENANDFK